MYDTVYGDNTCASLGDGRHYLSRPSDYSFGAMVCSLFDVATKPNRTQKGVLTLRGSGTWSTLLPLRLNDSIVLRVVG